MLSRIRTIISVGLALMMLLAIGTTAFASLDFGRTGSITVTLRDNSDEHRPISGGTFTLRMVAEAVSENNNLSYVFTPEFAESGVDLSDLNAEGLSEQLAAYAEEEQIQGITRSSGEEGSVTFSDLVLGLYLIVQEGSVEGYYPIDPFIVSVPMTNADGTGWIYDVNASPKAEIRPIPEYMDLTVRKVWEDNDNEEGNRPVSVTIQLLQNGTVYDTIVLSEENNWEYTWEDLSAEYSWTVREIDVPSGYMVTYEYGEFIIIIKNTEKLTQTGQLNWPIPVLAGAGLVLLMGGWMMRFNKRKKDNA